jgi:competence protein ComEC
MPAGVLALLLMPFGLEAIPLAVMGEGIEAMLAVAHWVSSWPGATQAVGAMRIESLALITAGGLWMAVWQSSWRLLGVGLVAAGMATAALTTQPDVLIAADGDNVAIRGGDGQLHLLSSRRGRFDAEIWLRRDGDQREFADIRADDPMGFVCDATGCRAHVGGDPARSVLALWSIEALSEDCATTPIVIDLTRGWHPPCTAAKLFVNRSTLQREGAIAARFEDKAVVWTSVARERGDRPWVAPNPISSGARARSSGPAP